MLNTNSIAMAATGNPRCQESCMIQTIQKATLIRQYYGKELDVH